MKILVRVTRRDIDEGVEVSCEACPIALAVNRRLRRGYHAKITASVIVRTAQNISLAYAITPARALDFMTAFDGGEEVHPISFEIDLPAKFLRPRRAR